MKKLFLLAFLVSAIGFAQDNSATVLFDYDKFFLTDSAKSKLDAVILKMNLNQLKSVELNGNTDADGNSKYNITLSKNRANEVLQYLVSKGIPADKIQLRFDGENKPVAENASDTGKQQNRRVEITFAFEEEQYTNTIFTKLQKESQHFTGKSNEVITITGKEGTKITIPKNTLMKANGKYAIGKIDIELQEFYKKSDAVGANLHTMSNGIMLESGGMIYIKATSKGEELQLKKGSKMTIEFASKNNPGDMQTFYGYQKKDKSVDWSTNELIPVVSEDEQDGNAYWMTISTYFINDKIISRDTVRGSSDGLETSNKRFQRKAEESKNVKALQNTILQSTKLGWINCDRFYDVKDKTDLFVNVDLKYKPEVRLIFKDINSIMSGYINNDNKVVLGQIPIGQKATLIAFSCVADEVYMAVKEIEIDKNGAIDLALNKTSLEEFKTAVQQLN
ncbi:OmpA family protein [Flavobacterium terrisoli]|uniref:OmpA family protein n=1 Tax=Flavobacterium terrisoli TaxID=3242195 RepID=UPI002542714C|nr:OmpA family protein [Flavobacterium buctense]